MVIFSKQPASKRARDSVVVVKAEIYDQCSVDAICFSGPRNEQMYLFFDDISFHDCFMNKSQDAAEKLRLKVKF